METFHDSDSAEAKPRELFFFNRLPDCPLLRKLLSHFTYNKLRASVKMTLVCFHIYISYCVGIKLGCVFLFGGNTAITLQCEPKQPGSELRILDRRQHSL